MAEASEEWREAVAYYRVSTDEQAQRGVSLEAQRERVEAFAHSERIVIVDHPKDPGKTGADLDRDGIQIALSYLKKRPGLGLVVAKLDRLTRSLRDFENLVDRYFGPGKGHTLHVVADPVDLETATGRMLARIRLAVAQHELETVVERTADAMSHKRGRGERLGTIPYGKEIDPDGPTNRDGKLVGLRDNPVELSALSWMRMLREADASFAAIAKALNESNIPTRKGGPWRASTVAAVLGRTKRGMTNPEPGEGE